MPDRAHARPSAPSRAVHRLIPGAWQLHSSATIPLVLCGDEAPDMVTSRGAPTCADCARLLIRLNELTRI